MRFERLSSPSQSSVTSRGCSTKIAEFAGGRVEVFVLLRILREVALYESNRTLPFPPSTQDGLFGESFEPATEDRL